MKIVVIDDESTARSLLKNILYRIDKSAFEIFEAGNLKDGVDVIKREKPKLVFLDIEMPNEQGIEIFKYFQKDEITFELVFSTAYSEYALTAFEMNAIDYILKPIRPKRVLEVVEKVQNAFNAKDIQTRLFELKQSLTTQSFQKIGVPVYDGIIFLLLDDIIHLEADGMYTNIFMKDGESLMVSKPLKFFDRLVQSGKPFYRPHRSHIFNIQFLKQYVKRDGGYILLDNDHILPLSKDRKDEFVQLISDL
ncbi:MAG: response regulator transcription factor [Cryomorphaceae bacterium]|nr:response regulator transcription factor [Cryomorphaceae bacterium]